MFLFSKKKMEFYRIGRKGRNRYHRAKKKKKKKMKLIAERGGGGGTGYLS